MSETHTCEHCDKRKQEEMESAEFNFAIMVSLLPLVVFTLFGQIGLF